MKKVLAVILAAGIMVSSFSTTIDSEAASKKQTVYVVTKIEYSGKHKAGGVPINVFPRRTFEYNKNGLVEKIHAPQLAVKDSYADVRVEYFYKGEKVVKVNDVGLYTDFNFTFKLIRNKKGNITGRMVRYNWITNPKTGKVVAFKKDKYDSPYKYDASNRIISGGEVEGNWGVIGQYTYDKKGRIKTYKRNKTIASKYSYDKKGYVNKINKDGKKTVLKNTYKNGRLTKRVVVGGRTSKIYYKKITVPEKYVELIQKQQRNLVEENSGGIGIPIPFIRN